MLNPPVWMDLILTSALEINHAKYLLNPLLPVRWCHSDVLWKNIAIKLYNTEKWQWL